MESGAPPKVWVHAGVMRRVGKWRGLALVTLAILLGAVEAVLQVVHAHWPQGLLVGFAALAGGIVLTVKPVVDAVSSTWATRVTDGAEREKQRRSLLDQIAPGSEDLPRVSDLGDARARLGIHPAIPLPLGADTSLPVELPLYIPRDLHTTVTTWITTHERSGGLLLLVGQAGAGKTRCMYEAAKDKLPDAPILLPRNAEHLAAFLDTLDPHGGPVVVWLNEIYNLLGLGKLTADHVHRALGHTRPLLMLASIWPDRYATLASDQGAEINHDAQEILTRLAQTHQLPTGFSRTELDHAEHLAHRDPRLREAIDTSIGDTPEVTGALAAKPRLLAHWNQPSDPYTHAILTAAIIAVRCGHPDPIPTTVLEPLARAHLTPAQAAQATEAWFTDALAELTRPLPGLTITPLEPRATAPGHIDGYRAHDILAQYAPLSLNNPEIRRLIDHATASACLGISTAISFDRSMRALAILATRKATTSSDTDLASRAMFHLGVLLAEQGDLDGARTTYQAVIDTGHSNAAPAAALQLGEVLKEQGELEGARIAYRQAIDTGHPKVAPTAAVGLGFMLEKQGDLDGARTAFQVAIDAEYVDMASTAAISLGTILKEQGDLDGACTAFRQAIDTGQASIVPIASLSLGMVLHEQGKLDGARAAFQVAIDSKHTVAAPAAVLHLGEVLENQGDSDGARIAFQEAIDTKHVDIAPAAAVSLGVILVRQGDLDGAQTAFQLAIDAEHVEIKPMAMFCLGLLRHMRGDLDGARIAYKHALETGHIDGVSNLAKALESMMAQLPSWPVE